MSKANVKQFFNKVNEDQKLQEQLASLAVKHHEELVKKTIEIGAENGYIFSEEDMNQLTKESVMESGQLSEAEMEEVAGGGMTENRLTVVNPIDHLRLRLTVIDPDKHKARFFDDENE